MLDDELFAEWLHAYKRDLPGFWKDERYKWEAVKTFQENWDINAVDLRGMLEVALSGCDNLLTTRNRFPGGMLMGFAGQYPERVRAMLIDLFDESKDLWERIDAFKKEADDWREETKGWNESQGKGYNHYQDENSITTYLWLKYPTKHYIYKYGIARALWQQLKTGRPIKKGAYASNVRNDEATYNEICDRLAADPDVRGILDSLLDEKCDRDDALHTLTIDFGHYVWYWVRHGGVVPSGDGGISDAGDGWWPKREEYDPGLTTEKWLELLGDESVFDQESITVMERFLGIGGAATCTQLAEAYGGSKEYYNVQSVNLARRVHDATGCPTVTDDENARWWPILYVGRHASKDEAGSYVWKLRSELAEALRRYGIGGGTDDVDIDGEDETSDPDPYTKADFLSEAYMSEERYERLRGVLANKLNLILQGAPGVGKTFCARRLAWSIMGCKDDSRIQMVQFHQSYTYEDFIMGYKPDGEGFALKEGVFYRFCKKAEADPGRKYFFIIDEINRGNLSKVLGELMMLIEKNYRGVPLTLAYRDEEFAVPGNLYIIGMMNTADRSLALIDYALRRRFAFFEMRPGFDSEQFQAYREGLGSDTLDLLVGQIQSLNAEIRHDPTLGKGFEIGHSHLCGREVCDDEWLREVVDYDIIPTLEEYWFDSDEKVSRWKATLRGVFEQ